MAAPANPVTASAPTRRTALRWALAAASLLIGACATLSAPPDRLHTGRFSATTLPAPGATPPQSVSGRFTVEVRGTRRIIDVATPLGNTIARVDLVPGSATATGPHMQSASGPDADALVEQLLGWRLPVTGLADWIEARPAPGRPARVEGDAARPTLIEQDGWLIRIAEYGPAGTPRLLTLERPPALAEPGLRLRLVLDDPAA